MRRYQKVEWHHDRDDYPVLLYSEIGDGGEELRKVDVYSDGHLDFADSVRSTGSTLLSEKPMLALDRIAAQPEFTPHAITAEEFEKVWREAIR